MYKRAEQVPPATAFGACTQQLLCGVNPKYSRAILPLVVTLLAINQRDAGSWVNQRHQISDVKVLFQIVVNQRHIICDVRVFKHNKNLSATQSILMGGKLFENFQCNVNPPPHSPLFRLHPHAQWLTQDRHGLKY